MSGGLTAALSCERPTINAAEPLPQIARQLQRFVSQPALSAVAPWHQRTHTGAKRSDADAPATCSASAAERMRRTFGIWTADCVNEIGSGTVPYQQTLLPKAQSERVECGY